MSNLLSKQAESYRCRLRAVRSNCSKLFKVFQRPVDEQHVEKYYVQGVEHEASV